MHKKYSKFNYKNFIHKGVNSLLNSDNTDFIQKGMELPGVIAVIFLLILFFMAGCEKDRDSITLPLKEGKIFKYTGKYTSSSGNKKPITLTAPEHRIEVERSFDSEQGKKYLLTFYIGNDRLLSLIGAQEEDGFYLYSGKKGTRIFPKDTFRGDQWENERDGSKTHGKTGSRVKIKTPLGEETAREIFLENSERTRIKLCISNTLGIVALDYSYISDGQRVNANLLLSSVEEPDENQDDNHNKNDRENNR